MELVGLDDSVRLLEALRRKEQLTFQVGCRLHPQLSRVFTLLRQAYAALYQWHAGYRLDSSLFGKVGAGKVLQTLHNFAKKESVGGCIRLGTEVTSVRDLTDSRCAPHFLLS